MGNTEGSRVISQVFRARRNLKLILSDEQMSIIMGSVLGDAYVYPQGKICFEQGESQRFYLEWKYAKLKKLAYPKIARVERLDKRNGKKTISYRFFLKQYFRPIRKLFYQNGEKIIPAGIDEWLNPLLISVWYMDDGHLDKGKSPLLATDSFSQRDVQLLASLIEDKFHLQVKVASKNRLRINSDSALRFFQLVSPWIHPDLRYKLP